MKNRKHLLLIAALGLAAAGLSGCWGGDDNNGTMTTSPPPTTTPPPTSSPQATDFTAFVHEQFASDVRTSETAMSVDVNSLTFEMNDLDNPHAYDDLLPQPGSSGG